MSKRAGEAVRDGRGFLMSLLRDVRANAMVIMGMALIPLAGLVGGGLDISRMYILKTRLQHACDAGALAGRRAMGGGTWAYDNNYPGKQAKLFFDANFKDGSFGSTNEKSDFTEKAGKVTGKASADIPMTLMQILGETTKTIDVTCDAEMRLPNTDVMFVLDTTGSMTGSAGGGQTKMQALKIAVKCFYEIVARLDTDANCTTGTPSGGTGQEVQIRFGFVPYATNANVGRLLKTDWMAENWDYQTRTPRWWVRRDNPTSTAAPYVRSTTKGKCNGDDMAAAGPNSDTASGSGPGAVRTIITTTSDDPSWNSGTCTGTGTTTTAVYDWREGGFGRPEDLFIQWRYNKLPVNVGRLKDGMDWKASFDWPIDPAGKSRTVRWDGCVEERLTHDLDIDMTPTANEETKWGPVLNDAIFPRNNKKTKFGDVSQWSMAESITKEDYINNVIYACATEARKLQEWKSANVFDDYVDSLTPAGNTYHDVGLIWGARLISPTGLFASENAFTPKGGEIERHLIFMTDGDACAENYNYTHFGVAWFDRRQLDSSSPPTGGCTYNNKTLVEQINTRTEAICAAAKNKNITLWTIAFGGMQPETEKRLKDCATPGRYFKATSGAALQQTFKQIADQISMLRLTN